LVSVLKSCQHRTEALEEATALTDTVLAGILKEAESGSIERSRIIELVYETLARFDHAAAVQYQAYHPL
jgi:hypothetical protein